MAARMLLFFHSSETGLKCSCFRSRRCSSLSSSLFAIAISSLIAAMRSSNKSSKVTVLFKLQVTEEKEKKRMESNRQWKSPARF